MNQSSNEQSKIFVAGSSWARGEWNPNKPMVQHDGIKQYFSDAGYAVIDCSQARSYHSRVIEHLSKKLEQHFQENDIVFFILADPLLDIIMPELALMKIKRDSDAKNLPVLTKAIADAGGLINLLRIQQDSIYQQLDTLAKQYNTKIHLIGGTYNVNTNISSKYLNLVPTVVSWIDLMIGHLLEYPHVKDPEFGVTYTWEVQYIDTATYSTEFAEQVIKEFRSIMLPSKLLEELIFHPDGLHPNREGHKILFDYLVNTLHL